MAQAGLGFPTGTPVQNSMAQAGLNEPLTMKDRGLAAARLYDQGFSREEINQTLGIATLPQDQVEQDQAMGTLGLLGYGAQSFGESVIRGAGDFAGDRFGAEGLAETLEGFADVVGPSEEQEEARRLRDEQRGFGGDVVDAVAQEAPGLLATIGAGAAAGAAAGSITGPGALATAVGGAVAGGIGWLRLRDENRRAAQAGKLAEQRANAQYGDGATPDQIRAIQETLSDDDVRAVELDQDDLARVDVAAAVGAAPEALAPIRVLNRVTGGTAGRQALGSAINRAARSGIKDAVTEGVTEVAQMAITELTFNPALRAQISDGEARELAPYVAQHYGRDVALAFLSGAGLGGAAGAASGAYEQRISNARVRNQIAAVAGAAEAAGLDTNQLEERAKTPEGAELLRELGPRLEEAELRARRTAAEVEALQADNAPEATIAEAKATARAAEKVRDQVMDDYLPQLGGQTTSEIREARKAEDTRMRTDAIERLGAGGETVRVTNDLPTGDLVALANELEPLRTKRLDLTQKLASARNPVRRAKVQKDLTAAIEAEGKVRGKIAAQTQGQDPALSADNWTDETKTLINDQISGERRTAAVNKQIEVEFPDTLSDEQKVERAQQIIADAQAEPDKGLDKQIRKLQRKRRNLEDPTEIDKVNNQIRGLEARRGGVSPAVEAAQRVLQDLAPEPDQSDAGSSPQAGLGDVAEDTPSVTFRSSRLSRPEGKEKGLRFRSSRVSRPEGEEPGFRLERIEEQTEGEDGDVPFRTRRVSRPDEDPEDVQFVSRRGRGGVSPVSEGEPEFVSRRDRGDTTPISEGEPEFASRRDRGDTTPISEGEPEFASRRDRGATTPISEGEPEFVSERGLRSPAGPAAEEIAQETGLEAEQQGDAVVVRGPTMQRAAAEAAAAARGVPVTYEPTDAIPANDPRRKNDDLSRQYRWEDRIDDVGADATVDDVEAAIIAMAPDVEFSAAFGPDGRILGFGTNNHRNMVVLPEATEPGSVMTHSHPDQVPFSAGDVWALSSMPNVAQLRAVLPDGQILTMSRGSNPLQRQTDLVDLIAPVNNIVASMIPPATPTIQAARIRQEAALRWLDMNDVIDYDGGLSGLTTSEEDIINDAIDQLEDGAGSGGGGLGGDAGTADPQVSAGQQPAGEGRVASAQEDPQAPPEITVDQPAAGADVQGEGASDIQTLLEQARERIATRSRLAEDLASDDGPVRLGRGGMAAAVTPSTYGTPWRTTYFDEDGQPTGHTDHQNKYDAVLDALDLGYRYTPVAPSGVTPLYVARPVVDGGQEILDWAEANGFTDLLPLGELHATVAYSREPFDVDPVPPQQNSIGGRARGKPEQLGDSLALRVTSPTLRANHRRYRDAGASHDYPDFLPHITFKDEATPEDVARLASVPAFDGRVTFGPEFQDDLDVSPDADAEAVQEDIAERDLAADDPQIAPSERVASAIDVPPGIDIMPEAKNAFSDLVNSARDPMTAGRTSAQWLEDNVFNRFAPIRRLEIRQRGKLGIGSESAFKAAETAVHDSGRSEALLFYGAAKLGQYGEFQTADGTVGLRTIFDTASGGATGEAQGQRMADWMGYMVARRIKELRDQGNQMRFPMSDADVADYLGRETPEFKQAADMWRDHNNANIQFLVDTGRITKEQADAMRSTGAYVPFYRSATNADGSAPDLDLSSLPKGPRGGGELLRRDPGIKALKGGDKKAIDNIMLNMIRNSQAMVAAGMRNDAANKIFDLMGEAGLAKTVKGKESKKPSENAMAVWRDGKKKWVVPLSQDAEPLLVAMAGLQPLQLGRIQTLMAGIGSIFRQGITLSPSFMIRNAIRGAISTGLLTTGANLTAANNTLTGFRDAYNNGQATRAFKAQSGMGDFNFGNPTTGVGKDDILMEYGITPKTWGYKFRQAVESVEKVGTATELADRVSAYQTMIARGMRPDEAAYQARAIMDYSRKGSLPELRAWLPMVPFLNARLQGYSRLVEGAVGKRGAAGRKQALMQLGLNGLVLMALSGALWARNAFDEERLEKYREEPLHRRLNYHVVYVGDKTVLIPKAFELGHIFSTIPELFADSMVNDMDELGAGAKKLAADTVGFNLIPAAALPVIEGLANYSFFTGRPLEGRREQALRAADRISGASALTQMIGRDLGISDLTKVSPTMIEHYFQGYGGAYFLSVASALDIVAGELGYGSAPVGGAFGDLPIASSVAQQVLGSMMKSTDQVNSKFVEEFYRNKEHVTQIYRSAKDAAAVGDVEYARRLLTEVPMAQSAYKLVNKAGFDLGEINREIRTIRGNVDMTPEQKRDSIEPLIRARNSLVKQVALLIDKMEEKQGVTFKAAS